MTKYAVLENNIVTNVVVASTPPDNAVAVAAGVGVQIGYEYNGSTFSESQEAVEARLNKWRQDASVPMRNLRKALRASNLLTEVVGAINALPSPAKEDALDDWEYSHTVDRLHPFVVYLSSSLNKTDEELDSLFRLAQSYS